VGRPFDPKSQVMATLEMAGFGPITGARETAGFNMAVSTRQQTGLNKLIAVVVTTTGAEVRSVSGVTIAVMGQ